MEGQENAEHLQRREEQLVNVSVAIKGEWNWVYGVDELQEFSRCWREQKEDWKNQCDSSIKWLSLIKDQY